jgi:thiamine-monophosphate kinase
MMDISDGLLLDARRMADASRCSITIDLAALPLSSAFVAERGQGLASRIFAATGGDDYALLGAFPADFDPATLSLPSGTRITRIGSIGATGPRLSLTNAGEPVQLPERLGFEHEGSNNRRLPDPQMGDRH